MKSNFIYLFLVLFTFLYACQNTNPQDDLNASDETTMQEDPSLTTTPSNPGGYSTSTNVSPPLEKADVPTLRFNVNASQAKTLEIVETGTSIMIPAHAFVDADGQPVEGEVEIQFKEYHDVGDILASGIPMRMTAPDGSTGYMQSAGMFDIQGTADGKAIFIAEGKTIDINLASDYNDASYDFWTFEKGSQQWINKGVSNAQPNIKREKALKRIAQTKPVEKPIQPYKFDKNKPVLEFDINYDNFPELKEMNGILWQYAGGNDQKDPVKNKWIFQEDWDVAEIEPFPSGNLYRLKLKNNSKSFITTVCPSQSGKEFEAAMQDYAQKQQEYEANKLSIADLKEMAKEQAEFIRSASVSGFGIYNYDLMVKDESNILVDAKFDFGTMIPGINKLAKVYMIVDNRNVVVYPFSDWNKVRIDPTTKTRMLAILPGQKYATITETQFAEMMDGIKGSKGQSYTFKMSYQDQMIASLDELKNIINRLV